VLSVDKIKKKEYLPLSRYLHRSISCLSQRDKAETAAGIVAKLWNTRRAQTEAKGRSQCAAPFLKSGRKRDKANLFVSHHDRSISCLSLQDKAKTAVGIVVKLWNTWRAQTETEGRSQGAIG